MNLSKVIWKPKTLSAVHVSVLVALSTTKWKKSSVSGSNLRRGENSWWQGINGTARSVMIETGNGICAWGTLPLIPAFEKRKDVVGMTEPATSSFRTTSLSLSTVNR